TELSRRLVSAYKTVRMGDPLEEQTLLGPLVGSPSIAAYQRAIETAKAQGGEVLCGGGVPDRKGFFVEPTIVKAPKQASFPIAWEETFAPILYLFEVEDLDEAIAAQNAVTQGL